MNRALLLALSIALAVALQACTPEAKQATQVMLEVDAEPGVRARLAKLTIEIRGGAADDAYSDYEGDPVTELEEPELPLQIGLVPRGGDASRRYQVTVRARAQDGSFVAEARVISGYVAGSIRFARLVLEDACLDVDQCLGSEDEPLTCRRGACADPGADVRRFSSARDKPSLIEPESPGAEGSDAGETESDGGGSTPVDGGDNRDGGGGGGSSDAGVAQGTCKLGSSKVGCRLGM
ncbi:MAG TPA: hypothetical protein VFZ61_23405 [Polyangiales bacterium]